MNAETLRELQEPLKAKYRTDPASAMVTLHATGSLGEGVSCSVDTGRMLAVAGLHPPRAATVHTFALATWCCRRSTRVRA